MKIKNLLLFAAAASLSFGAMADDLATGELAFLSTGEPATSGQPTNDHFFVRGTFDGVDVDNNVSFKAGDTQEVWFYLDDDEIYMNEAVQALTPIAYNAAGDLYNEITYNSFQFDLYVPQRLELVIGENEEGEEITFLQGDRLPSSSTITWGKKEETKEVDGITYDVYTVVCYNSNAYGSHLSAKNASRYKNNGALKKDASVFAFQIKDNNPAGENHIGDMIIANTLLNLRETAIAEWTPNESTFFYGTGGNMETQRFQNYSRVHMHGSADVVENLAEKTINNVKYYNVAGMQSNVPFDGVNIMVTTYNDGTTSTSKVIK